MTFFRSTKNKPQIGPALFCSLLLHVIAGAGLIFWLLTSTVSAPALNGSRPVWISLATQTPDGAPPIKKDRKEQIKAVSKPNTPVVMAQQSTAAVAVDFETREFSGDKALDATLTNYQSGMQNSVADGNADNMSSANTAIAHPLYKENAPPVYPEVARVRGYEGMVFVLAEILSNGTVGKLKIGKSSGYAILDQSAVEAVKPWKFEPARRSGTPFTAWVQLPIKYTLKNNSQS